MEEEHISLINKEDLQKALNRIIEFFEAISLPGSKIALTMEESTQGDY